MYKVDTAVVKVVPEVVAEAYRLYDKAEAARKAYFSARKDADDFLRSLLPDDRYSAATLTKDGFVVANPSNNGLTDILKRGGRPGAEPTSLSTST